MVFWEFDLEIILVVPALPHLCLHVGILCDHLVWHKGNGHTQPLCSVSEPKAHQADCVDGVVQFYHTAIESIFAWRFRFGPSRSMAATKVTSPHHEEARGPTSQAFRTSIYMAFPHPS